MELRSLLLLSLDDRLVVTREFINPAVRCPIRCLSQDHDTVMWSDGICPRLLA